MAMTVITISNAPMSLRGDLTKWMQEIATGVYIGALNPRIREALWERVVQSVGKGQATLSYATRNELGYQFETHRTLQMNISFDGIPLVMIPKEEKTLSDKSKYGFSKQAKFRRSRKYAIKKTKMSTSTPYIVIDIETTGLNPLQDDIIEIAALRVEQDNYKEYHSFILIKRELPKEIVELTGITNQVLINEGRELSNVLDGFVDFIGALPIVGYNVLFDVDFLNNHLRRINRDTIKNRKIDLMSLVKKEKMFLNSYKLQDVLLAYGLEETVEHKALSDARLTYALSTKVNGFARSLKRKP